MKKLIIILLLGAAFWQFYLSKPGNPIISNIAGDGQPSGQLAWYVQPLAGQVAFLILAQPTRGSGGQQQLSLRWPHPLLANDLLCRSHLLPAQLPGHQDGWRQPWRAL